VKRAPLILAVLALTGCGTSEQPSHPTDSGPATTRVATTAETQTVPSTTQLVVYRLHGGELAPQRIEVPRARSVAAAALDALGLAAPITIDSGTAVVERADATPAEVAQIVYTLTRFPAIRRVDIGGRRGLTRADVERFVAPILVENPLPGDVFDRREVTGTASVFEATLVVELLQRGRALARSTVSASEGAPERGSFVARFDSAVGVSGAAIVVAFSPSAADGSEQHRVEVPVTLR